MVLVSLLASLILLVLVCVQVGRTGKFHRGMLLAFGTTIPAYLCLAPTLLVHALVLVSVLAVLAPFPLRPRWFVLSAVVSSLALFGVFGYKIHKETAAAWDPIREQFPLESLEGRLAQNGVGKGTLASLPEGQSGKPGAAWTRLEEVEGEVAKQQRLRTSSLEVAHAGYVERFINTPGFGVGRMIRRPSPYYARREQEEPGLLPAKDYKIYLSPLDAKPDYPAPPGVQPTNAPAPRELALLWPMHRAGVLEFLNPEGFGFVQSKDKVAGFRPHRFRSSPQGWQGADEPWQLERLELVGLLKSEQPRLYVSDHLPSMVEAAQLKTRPLNAFENPALELLRSGDDLACDRQEGRLRVLGAIRAGQPCLKCHDAQRGDLLGAFSYVLRKVP